MDIKELHAKYAVLCGPDCVDCWGDKAWIGFNEDGSMLYWAEYKLKVNIQKQVSLQSDIDNCRMFLEQLYEVERQDQISYAEAFINQLKFHTTRRLKHNWNSVNNNNKRWPISK